MGGQACGVLPRVFLLVDFHTLCRLGGVAGWNMTPEVVNGFGTLLGPEETPCRWVGVFLVPLPALAV